MSPDLLRSRGSVAELEAEHLVDGVPFGQIYTAWRALTAQMLPGDELWRWSSSPEDWQRLRGWEGIALVRSGEIVDCFLTALN